MHPFGVSGSRGHCGFVIVATLNLGGFLLVNLGGWMDVIALGTLWTVEVKFCRMQI